jgi:hypothetical protein
LGTVAILKSGISEASPADGDERLADLPERFLTDQKLGGSWLPATGPGRDNRDFT